MILGVNKAPAPSSSFQEGSNGLASSAPQCNKVAPSPPVIILDKQEQQQVNISVAHPTWTHSLETACSTNIIRATIPLQLACLFVCGFSTYT